MKKHQPRARKLRKCELGKKTRSFNKGCRYRVGFDGRLYAMPNWQWGPSI